VSPAETVLTMVVGAALSILGGVVAQFLSYRFESRAWKKELAKERLEEIRQVALAQIGLAEAIRGGIGSDWAAPDTDAGYKVWLGAVDEWLEGVDSLPAGGAGVVAFTNDRELIDLAYSMQSKGNRVVDLFMQVMSKREVPEWGEDACAESDEACKKVLARADEVLRKV
jgi:hypothetical protein